MKIKYEQLQILKSFQCERLSCNKENESLIKNFVNEKGRNLVGYLKEKAWIEDVNNETAFYLIKNEFGIPCLFFSLKCGAMYELFDEKGIQDFIEKYKDIISQIHKPDDIVSKAIELQMHPAELYSILTSDLPYKKSKIAFKHDDENKDDNSSIIRVHKNLPGIELVHFCADEIEQLKWNKAIMQHSMGETLFWHFIVPVVEETLKYVGCQYLFLFAADSTIDGSLVNYYNVSLKFSAEKKYGTSKPLYDFGCYFMHQKIDEVIKNRDLFFESFNKDDDEELI